MSRHTTSLKLSAFFISALLLGACGGESNNNEMDSEKDSTKTEEVMVEDEPTEPIVMNSAVETNGITITPLVSSPKFENAKLTFANVSSGDKLKAGKKTIKMNVENYELGVQTSDAEGKGLANSKKGQHMHVILNNEPYMAHYDPEVEVELEDGHYVALTFFSRSYHESVKSKDAYDIIQFTVGDNEAEEADLDAAHIFYSRPKGTYKGNDTKDILFDFYLLNTELGENGNKVRLTINGETSFTIAKWQAYTISGLPMGENTFKVELMDNDGELIETPFNPVERTVTLAEE